MGLYSNFGLWFSPGFPLARETSQGSNGGSKRVRAGLVEEGQRFPTLQPPTRMEIAFRLIPTERSSPHPTPRDAIHLFLSPSLPQAGQGRGMPDFNIREIKITLLYLHRVMGKRTIILARRFSRWRMIRGPSVLSFELKEIDSPVARRKLMELFGIWSNFGRIDI